jgi:RHS repeat-associated protein
LLREYSGGTLSQTSQFVYDDDRLEARDTSGAVSAQYFARGQTHASNIYFYTTDHLGSIRDLSSSSGTIQTTYNYDIFGRGGVTQTTAESDFQYAGLYFHQPSGLSLALHRNYKANVGRWLSRDPLGEGNNLYDYVGNNPISYVDLVGLEKQYTGIASWYGPGFEGKKTACGQIFHSSLMTGAMQPEKVPHLPTYVTVTYKNKSIRVKINDRGPYPKGVRLIDLSKHAFIELTGGTGTGLVNVTVTMD